MKLHRLFVVSYLRCPLLAIDESGFGMPLRAASCCSNAFDSKYSSHAAASCNNNNVFNSREDQSIYPIFLYALKKRT
jgi:hypothetical protein